jgi:TetR/AcrR family acrAB operon transcriptional repressor
LNKFEAVDDAGTFHPRRVNCHREGQRKIENLLRNAIRQGQLPETLDVRLGSIATIAFIDGLVNNWIMFPGLLDVNTEIPLMLDGLTEMLRAGFKCSGIQEKARVTPVSISSDTKA